MNRKLNFLEKAIYDLTSQRLLCLCLSVYFFKMPLATPDQWWIEPVKDVLTTLGATNQGLQYAAFAFLGFAVFGGVILKSYFGIGAAKVRKQEPNIVKQTVVREARGGTIKGIISRLPAHLQELISKR